MEKKAQLGMLQGLITALVVVAMTLVIGFLVMSNVDTQVRDTEGFDGENLSVANNATNDVIDAIAIIPSWMNIIVITVIGALLIGLVALFNRNK